MGRELHAPCTLFTLIGRISLRFSNVCLYTQGLFKHVKDLCRTLKAQPSLWHYYKKAIFLQVRLSVVYLKEKSPGLAV